jgi:hypothetical protein
MYTRRYEGTGRSLSLKLLQQLRAEGAKLSSGDAAARAADAGAASGAGGRTFREVQLQEPIRHDALSYLVHPTSSHACNAGTVDAMPSLSDWCPAS